MELARHDVIRLCTSNYVEAEIRELPRKWSPRLRIDDERVERLLADVTTFALRIETVPQRYVLERDPDDSHYINLALASGAQLITSRDRHLLDLTDRTSKTGDEFGIQFPDLRILTPEQLLSRIKGRS